MSNVVEIYGTLRDSKPFFIIDSSDTEVSGNLVVLQNLDVCGNITFNNTDLSSALANLVVDLTGGQDASFTNVDISGSLLLNNIDISGKLTQINTSLIDLASSGDGTITELLDLEPNTDNSSAIINQIANIFKEPWWLTYNNVFRYSPAGGGGFYNSYGGGVLTHTGRIVFIPLNATYFSSYRTDTHYFVPNGGPDGFTRVSPFRAFFSGGVLAPNGKVICIPHSSPYVGIFDPNFREYGDYLGSYTDGVAHGKGDTAYAKGVLAPNGKIIFFPYATSNIGIYDPSNDTLIDSSATGVGGTSLANKCTSAVLLPNGKMITIPSGNNYNIGIYDPEADTWTSGPSHGQGDHAYSEGVLAPNGNVILIPKNQNRIGIYDPYDTSIGKFTLGAVIPDPYGSYSSGVLAPNGKIIFVPYNAVNIGIYDPETNIFEHGPYIDGNGPHFMGGVLAPTGEIIFVPYLRQVGIYGNKFPLNYKNDLLAPYFNSGGAPP